MTPVSWILTVLHVPSSELHEGTHSMMAVRTEVPGDMAVCFLRLGLHTDMSHHILITVLHIHGKKALSSNEWLVCKAISNFALQCSCVPKEREKIL